MRNRLFLLPVIPFVLTCKVGSAEQHEHRELSSHEHGVGQLNVAKENETLNIELISPAMNIVGFEHTPENPAQEQAVQNVKTALEDAEQVFSLPAEAQCQLAKAEVETDIEDEHDEEHHDEHDDEKHAAHEDGDEHDEEVHSEFHVSYEFSCAKPDGLTHVDVNLFTLFPGTVELQVQLIGEQGQSKTKLTADSARIEL